MLIEEIRDLLDAKVHAGQTLLSLEVSNGFGSDDMNPVMAFVKKKTVLLTGLVTDQAVRTAKMMNIHCIVFVRGAIPSEEVIQLAEEMKIVLMTTDHRMFDSCGILYSAGLGRENEEKTDQDFEE